MKKKQTVKSDSVSRARQIAEKAKPNMRVVQVIPQQEEAQAAPDAIAPEVEAARRKYGFKAATSAKPAKDLHMVVMEPKQTTDARVAPNKLTLIVDDDKVVGEQG
jgi:hypothetical protein